MLNYYGRRFNLQKYPTICKVQDLSDFYLCRTSKYLGVLQNSISFFKGVVHHLNVIGRTVCLEIYQTDIISFYYRVTNKQMLITSIFPFIKNQISFRNTLHRCLDQRIRIKHHLIQPRKSLECTEPNLTMGQSGKLTIYVITKIFKVL